MKTHSLIFPLTVLIFAFYACNQTQPDRHYEPIKLKVFGKDSSKNDSLSTFVNLYHFTKMDSLFKRIEDIVCKDSIPKILINSKRNEKIIYPINKCYRGMDISIRPPHNHIYIYDDTIVKYFVDTYPIDSLENVMQKDIENMGKNPDWCDHPVKLYTLFGDKHYNPNKLENKLNKACNIYEKLTNRRDIKIYITLPPLPPPPPPEAE
ncbi:MAG TPA: hypothetical protein VJ946_00735 [Bacteroidales bacterium]|nr:hypothetical protein [Bacteroidales bacterium]